MSTYDLIQMIACRSYHKSKDTAQDALEHYMVGALIDEQSKTSWDIK